MLAYMLAYMLTRLASVGSSRPARRSVALRGLLCCGLLSGCATASAGGSATTAAPKRPELRCARSGDQRLETASWRVDGRQDVGRVYSTGSKDGARTSVLVCREVDLNGDGRKDTLVYFDDSGRKQREELDQDYDGVADIKSYYEQGHLVRQERDVDNDGRPDLVEYYEQGRVVRIEKLPQAADRKTPPAAVPPG